MNSTYLKIKEYLNENNISVISNIPDSSILDGISSLENSDRKKITFFDDLKLIKFLKLTKALCCFVKSEYIDYLPENCFPIIVENPYLCFAHISNYFNPKITSNGIISKFINFGKDTNISNNVQIGNFSNIDDNVHLKKNVIIDNNVTLGKDVSIGNNTHIENNCTISNAIIGDNCHIKSGTIIGGSGFGFTLVSKVDISHSGDVIIGNNVYIGSNCCIDRASIDSTIIGNHVRIDNLVQIAHGVKIGNNTVIAGQVGIAGSSSIGFNCIIGGQVGIAGHINIGNNVTIAAKSGVTKNINNNMVVAGFPAIDIRKWKKNLIKINRI